MLAMKSVVGSALADGHIQPLFGKCVVTLGGPQAAQCGAFSLSVPIPITDRTLDVHQLASLNEEGFMPKNQL